MHSVHELVQVLWNANQEWLEILLQSLELL
jgi:hypothetical protein